MLSASGRLRSPSGLVWMRGACVLTVAFLLLMGGRPVGAEAPFRAEWGHGGWFRPGAWMPIRVMVKSYAPPGGRIVVRGGRGIYVTEVPDENRFRTLWVWTVLDDTGAGVEVEWEGGESVVLPEARSLSPGRALVGVESRLGVPAASSRAVWFALPDLPSVRQEWFDGVDLLVMSEGLRRTWREECGDAIETWVEGGGEIRPKLPGVEDPPRHAPPELPYFSAAPPNLPRWPMADRLSFVRYLLLLVLGGIGVLFLATRERQSSPRRLLWLTLGQAFLLVVVGNSPAGVPSQQASTEVLYRVGRRPLFLRALYRRTLRAGEDGVVSPGKRGGALWMPAEQEVRIEPDGTLRLGRFGTAVLLSRDGIRLEAPPVGGVVRPLERRILYGPEGRVPWPEELDELELDGEPIPGKLTRQMPYVLPGTGPRFGVLRGRAPSGDLWVFEVEFE